MQTGFPPEAPYFLCLSTHKTDARTPVTRELKNCCAQSISCTLFASTLTEIRKSSLSRTSSTMAGYQKTTAERLWEADQALRFALSTRACSLDPK